MLTVLTGDAIEQLGTLPDESVQCCVTSPPYWGLRDYGTAAWEGGEEGCDHVKEHSMATSGLEGGKTTTLHNHYHREQCPCGARRIDSQLGLEKTPEEYVEKIVEVFREVRRVLRKDGTLWLNLGDSYAGSGKGAWDNKDGGQKEVYIPDADSPQALLPKVPPGLKPKDLCGIPWRVAFALQADGWWLRSDIIWAKPNPMPESVTDRPTKAHEYLFLLTKSANYFYDAESIKENVTGESHSPPTSGRNGGEFVKRWTQGLDYLPASRNKRSVWTVATAPYPEAHFATYPPDLIKPCILAGTSAKGCCAKCGAPWERIVERSGGTIGTGGWNPSELEDPRVARNRGKDLSDYKVETLGWQPTCECVRNYRGILKSGFGSCNPPVPCTVLDPFAGSGTTGMVALELGRKAILIELNPKYCDLIRQRCDVTPGLQLA